ncbi:MAG: hypothetical protein SVT52_08255 [Planctomycetota bacterium]|nr:hypothetical protein [Planctomycetota bacterium]
MKRQMAAAGLAAMAIWAGTAQAAPRPSEIPVSWKLDIHYEQPKPIQVRLPGETLAKTFWYLRYTVTNRTGKDQIFVPDFVLYAGTGQVLRAGRGAPGVVFEAIKKLYNDPLLKDITGMTGKLLQGEDNAKNGVAIWTDIDHAAGSFDVFCGGLSGETVAITLPRAVIVNEMDAAGKMHDVRKEKALLVRTLHLKFAIPGEAAARFTTPARLVKKNWVMR